MHRWVLAALVAYAGCVKSDAVSCGDGTVCPEATVCDPTHGGCVAPEQLETCIGVADGTECTVTATNDGFCDREVCRTKFCGDNYVSDAEQCDGASVSTLTCANFGFYDAITPPCTDSCTYDLTMCEGFCGDGMVSGPEICDGSIGPTQTCLDYGYGAGNLGCASCGADFSDCETFGWKSLVVGDSGVREISGLADDDVYAVGNGLFTHFDGTTWSSVDTTGCNASELAFVHEVAPGLVFAAAGDGAAPDYGRVLRIANGGCTQYDVALQTELTGVYATSATDAWVTSLVNGVWHFDGTSWTQSISNAARDIVGFGPDDIYVVVASQPNSLLHWNGASWSPVAGWPSATLPNAHRIWGASGTDVWIAGYTDPPASVPVVLHYDGVSFTQPGGLSAFSVKQFIAGAARGDRTVMSALQATSFAPIVLEWDGTAWANLHHPSILGVTGLWMSPSNAVWSSFDDRGEALVLRNAVERYPQLWTQQLASSIQARNQSDALLATASGLKRFVGAAWTSVAASTTFYTTAKDPAGTMYALSYVDGLYRSDTGSIDTSVKGFALAAVGPGDLWVLGADSLTLVRWHAGTVTSPPALAPQLAANEVISSIAGTSPTNIYAVTSAANTFHFDGTSWQLVPTGVTERMTGLTVIGSDLYAAAVGGHLVHFDGTSWSVTDLAASVIYAIGGTGPSDVFVATSKELLHFDGTQWSPVDIGTQQPVFGIAAAGDSIFFSDFTRSVTQLVRTRAW